MYNFGTPGYFSASFKEEVIVYEFTSKKFKHISSIEGTSFRELIWFRPSYYARRLRNSCFYYELFLYFPFLKFLSYFSFSFLFGISFVFIFIFSFSFSFYILGERTDSEPNTSLVFSSPPSLILKANSPYFRFARSKSFIL